MEKKEKARRVEDLDVQGVVGVLERWEMGDFVEFVREKQVNGRKLLGTTEGIVKLWRPRANAKKFIEFIAELKTEPEKYLDNVKEQLETKPEVDVQAQYQTVKAKRIREQLASTSLSVEDILKKIVPAKSFLYRNQPTNTDKPVTSYLPMDSGRPKKSKRFFRLSSYEYPHFDIKQLRFSRTENFNDRGYYSVKTNSQYYIQKTAKKPESRKYKSLTTAEELEKCPEDHFYEDLNYNEVAKEDNDIREIKPAQGNTMPGLVKIQELFHSFKLPFFKKTEEKEGATSLDTAPTKSEKDVHIYENSDSAASMYDSIHINSQDEEHNGAKQSGLPVEDYLEPVQLTKDYCDVALRPRDDSILGYILSLFESFGIRRETNDSSPEACADADNARRLPSEPEDEPRKKSNMADRPLPVPVENEPYFMNIDRTEAENLLRGHPDGTFVLRPSSQPNHAYTLTVSCANAVHNVGVRRRPDGRLALGFARKGERSFTSVTSLLRHHRKRRLLLVAGGDVCGATTLNETPQYYQTPSNLPLPLSRKQ
ncbi:uncharacterized protein LOC126377066 [Pectinophora gossypiella]|uniref:uncharacterized protein LOC126377066 n=1 Tax=Pectinophora gossypiella TaxID=13191 RepID=UPI00214DFA69|nr:uncharacterized protein LOC126377066 [Pectinophora gossypiella]XP_049880660.1 uncharacterized protein LOC126377066 [Pectinophora gossypiella]